MYSCFDQNFGVVCVMAVSLASNDTGPEKALGEHSKNLTDNGDN